MLESINEVVKKSLEEWPAGDYRTDEGQPDGDGAGPGGGGVQI